jgi:damage-control phosphatase, subfamily I
MTTTLDCLPCFVRQTVEAVGFAVPDESRRAAIVRQLLADLSTADWQLSPVGIAQHLHRRIRQATGEADSYRALKERMNRLALDMLPGMSQDARVEEDPRMAIVRLAVAGNLIDAGAKSGITERDVREAMCRAVREPLYGSVSALFAAAEGARRILFLADNAGEIVFDRPLIEALPTEKITVAVRGAPVLNDATMEDAQVAGLTGLTPIITNGSDAPGTILEDCSAEFRRVYEDSDLIIAKGQGNYESLAATTKHIFFLLRVKCPLVAAQVGAKAGDMIVLERNVEGAP